ncbi:MAG: hypothetical protein FD153_106 [Rhodospirillaceae bacterium]|nr:MAG: hypothetical protein FD153_106 [Rhodospirillaceae bacterium]
MALETLREIALQFSKVQPKQIDHLTEETPFLDLVQFGSSTHDLWHNAEELRSADAMGFVAMDEPLPSINSQTRLIKFDLAKMGGMIEVGEDKARQLGGATKYFADKTGPVLKKTGMNTERVIVYNNLRQYALDRYKTMSVKRNIYDAGGTGDKNYSIIAVRFEEGVCQGLYNPKGFGKGVLFNTSPINGGNLYKIGSEGVLGYGVRLKCDLGFMMTGDRNISVIVNIDPSAEADKKPKAVPTAMMLDDMLADIRATDSGRTMLVMHHRVRSVLVREFKDTRIWLRPEDKVINRSLMAWDAIPFVTTYNMDDGSEAKVTV